MGAKFNFYNSDNKKGQILQQILNFQSNKKIQFPTKPLQTAEMFGALPRSHYDVTEAAFTVVDCRKPSIREIAV